MNKMRMIILVSISVMALVVVGFLTYQASAQKQAEDEIGDRLKMKGIPVIHVKTLSRTPYNIEIAIQSSSEDNYSPDDNWALVLAKREATFAYQYGPSVKSLSLILLNESREELDSAIYGIKPSSIIPAKKSSVSNEETEEIVASKLKLGEYTLEKLEVSNADSVGSDGQILSIIVSAPDFEAVKRSKGFYGSIVYLRENINREYGTSIVIGHFRLIDDEQGKVISDLIFDTEQHIQSSIGQGLLVKDGPKDDSQLVKTPKPTSPVIETTPVTEPYPPPEGEQPAEGVPLLQDTAYPYP